MLPPLRVESGRSRRRGGPDAFRPATTAGASETAPDPPSRPVTCPRPRKRRPRTPLDPPARNSPRDRIHHRGAAPVRHSIDLAARYGPPRRKTFAPGPAGWPGSIARAGWRKAAPHETPSPSILPRPRPSRRHRPVRPRSWSQAAEPSNCMTPGSPQPPVLRPDGQIAAEARCATARPWHRPAGPDIGAPPERGPGVRARTHCPDRDPAKSGDPPRREIRSCDDDAGLVPVDPINARTNPARDHAGSDAQPDSTTLAGPAACADTRAPPAPRSENVRND